MGQSQTDRFFQIGWVDWLCVQMNQNAAVGEVLTKVQATK
jgi:hypothetical protein